MGKIMYVILKNLYMGLVLVVLGIIGIGVFFYYLVKNLFEPEGFLDQKK
jgi:NhaP-type Na+/H+ or K+/H+ antiporter